MENVFSNLDVNENGSLRLKDIEYALMYIRLGESTAHEVQIDENFWKQVFQKVDKNKDGMIDQESIKELMIKSIDEQFEA